MVRYRTRYRNDTTNPRATRRTPRSNLAPSDGGDRLLALERVTGGVAFLLGRLLFGGVLAFMGLNHILQFESMWGDAAHQGVPAPGVVVAGSGVLLVVGGAGFIAGAYPVLSAAPIAAFLVVSALTMHDFWNAGDAGERQREMTQFLKNAALTGGALALLAVGGASWPFAVGLRLQF